MANETVAIPASALPPTGAQEYLDKMLARADAAEGTKPEEKPVDQKPAEQQAVDWEKRYKDLQAEFTRLKQTPKAPEQKPAEAPKDGEKKPEEVAKTPEEVAKTPEELKAEEDAAKAAEDALPPEAKEAKGIVDKAGLDWKDVNDTFARDGKLSDDHYAKLEAAGIPRTMVDQFTAGQVALQQSARNDALAVVGGEEAYGKIVEWARTSLSDAELTSYNKVVTGKDMAATKLAMQGLQAKFEAANGREPKLLNSERNSGVAGYQSVEEMKSDMRDPRYAKDAAFRKQVEDKVRNAAF